MNPIHLTANRPSRFYRGGSAIARFRGISDDMTHGPEDWVGSTTTIFGQESAGLSRVEGKTLRELVEADPEAFLGPEHVRRFGTDPALLVKLLDAGERLPIHCHPDREFARRHLDCPFGKTEAWIVVGTGNAAPLVYLGFARDVAAGELAEWVTRQDVDAMLAAMCPLEVAMGDAVFVPAGIPHAIGQGVFVVELQEPTDLSVLLEWDGFDIDGPADGHLGLGFELALQCVDRSEWGGERLERLRAGRAAGSTTTALLPPEADPFFRAERLSAGAVLEAGFSIVVVLGGEGRLVGEDETALASGDTVLVPFAAGKLRLEGSLDVVRCRPPATVEARTAVGTQAPVDTGE